MSDRSIFSALSFFIVVVAGLSLYPANAALALEQDHGNPGQFIDNIRKGISGLSKYFWSPKAQIPGESIEQPAKADKALAPVPKVPQTDAKKATKATKVEGARPATAARATTKQKPAGKPEQMIKLDNKMARVPVSPKTTFESKTAIDHKNKLAGPQKDTTVATKNVPTAKPAQKASGSSINAYAQPNSQPSAIANAKKQIAKQPATGKISSLVTPKAIVKNEPASAKPAKPSSPMTPTGKTAKDKKIGLTKPKTARKSVAKKSAAVSVQPKIPSIKKAAAGAIVAASAKTSKQQLVPNDKGTYIWVPNIGSQLSQRFGLTGIPAKGLHANGGLNRTDGRWAFAPKKRGMLPSIYGLSAEIHAAGDAGVWVGGGRNWVYVFDKNRSYGSIVGGAKAKKKAASKSGKSVASLKSGAKKPAIANKADKSAKTQKINKPGQAQIKKTLKKAAKLQKGIEVKRAGKKLAQAPRQQAVTKPLTRSAGQAKAGPKMARNGKWSRVNNRWVFVPQSKPGQMNGANMRGLADQVAKAPVTGGWVQRQNRWVYVAPQQGKTGAGANGPKRVQKGIVHNDTMPAKAKNKDVGRVPLIAEKKTAQTKSTKTRAAKKPVASAQAAKPGFAIVSKTHR